MYSQGVLPVPEVKIISPTQIPLQAKPMAFPFNKNECIPPPLLSFPCASIPRRLLNEAVLVQEPLGYLFLLRWELVHVFYFLPQKKKKKNMLLMYACIIVLR